MSCLVLNTAQRQRLQQLSSRVLHQCAFTKPTFIQSKEKLTRVQRLCSDWGLLQEEA